MAFSNANQATVAFKNLLGKSNTDVTKGLGNEAEGIFLNVPASAVFLSSIPSTPSGATSAGTAVFVTAVMTADTTSNGHGFFAIWPVSPPSGTDPYTLSSYAYGAGTLTGITALSRVRNAISPAFGFLYEAKPFDTAVAPISVGDARNWIYQYNSGVFFQQDNVGLNPGTIQLYAFTGALLSGANFTGGTGSGTSTFIQNGLNTYTGGTTTFPKVNVSALTISNLSVSGNANAVSFSATSLSGGTIYSGSTDLSLLFSNGANFTGQTIGTGTTSVFKQVSGSTFQFRSLTASGNTQLHTNTGDTITVSSSFGVKNIVLSSETITVDVDYQYLVYGDLTLYGDFFNYGQVVIINGALVLSGGTFTNNGSLLMPSLITGSKYTALFSATANTPFNITHNMGTTKLLYSTWDSSGNEVEIQLTKLNTNTVEIVTTSNIINAEIDIIGL